MVIMFKVGEISAIKTTITKLLSNLDMVFVSFVS